MTDIISEDTKAVFELLCACIESGDAALMLCKEKATGQNVPVIVCVNETEDSYEFYPVGRCFSDIEAEFDNYEPLLPDVNLEREDNDVPPDAAA